MTADTNMRGLGMTANTNVSGHTKAAYASLRVLAMTAIGVLQRLLMLVFSVSR